MARRNTRLSPKLSNRKSVVTEPRRIIQVNRNDPCPCGSGKKYKMCHIDKGEAFLKKIAKKQEKDHNIKRITVPWYRRVFKPIERG